MNSRLLTGGLIILISLGLSLLLTLLPLPVALGPARPAFFVMTVLFWSIAQPGLFGVIAAWCCGIVLDVLYGTPFSEHGLALAAAVYFLTKGRTIFLSFSLFQQALAMIPVFVLYEFILFWIDGVANLSVDPLWRWIPVATSAIAWPFWAFLMERWANFDVG